MFAGNEVSVPLVHVEQGFAVPGLDPLHHRHLLGEDVPSRPGAPQPLQEPPFLDRAQHRRGRVEGLRTAGRVLVILIGAARLCRAVLARIQQVELGEAAECKPTVEQHVWPARLRRTAQRHVLVIGLVGGRAPAQKFVPRRFVLPVDIPGVIIDDLVIVRGHDPGKGGMGGLQVGIRLIERIAVAILFKGLDFRSVVLPGVSVMRLGLIDVVTEEQDEFEILAGHMPVGGVMAPLVVLAGGKGKAQTVDGRIGGGRRAGPADGARDGAGAEAIPVPAARFQPLHLHVHGVAQLRAGDSRPFLFDGLHLVVRRHLPRHRYGLHRHSAAIERFRRQPGP